LSFVGADEGWDGGWLDGEMMDVKIILIKYPQWKN